MAEVRVCTGKGEDEVFSDLQTDAHLEQIKHFAAALESGTRPSTVGEDGIAALKVSLAALESARTGKVISLDGA